ncbi:metallophosphoesterase [Xanthomonas arboricola]|uniref:metallophosphoesterase n=1 Tax=Xanthomonas arboricola TaxID=56448 RepID=UPI001875DD67|nr:metallophosphoesterase [Xanthomonas arboricola]
MSVIIAQVSDLHIKNAESKGALRIAALAGALGSLRDKSDNLIILLTGDIAFSGSESEYKIANEALNNLKERLIQEWGYSSVSMASCPGNHDCDFSKQKSTVRDALLKSLGSGDSQIDIVNELAVVQLDYEEFAKSLEIKFEYINAIAKIAHIEVGGLALNLLCANTSWSSRLKEIPGSVRMPASLLPRVEQSEDLTIALLHHPLNWYDPQDAKSVSDWLDANADLALWGHEHREDSFLISRKKLGSSVQHYLARPLEDYTVECGFRCLVLSSLDNCLEVSFSLRGELFNLASEDLIKIRKNPARQLGQIRFSADFKQFLSDPGGVFKHPRVERNLNLQDIFIEPSFRPFTSGSSELDRVDRSLSAITMLDEIKKNSTTAIFGNEQSGKTTFAKHIIEDARHHGFTPLYFDCARLKSSNSGDVTAWIRSSVDFQYESDCAELVRQISPALAIVIVDNTHEIPGSPGVVAAIIERLKLLATRSIYLTAQNPALTILAASHSSGSEVKQWSDAKWYEVMPLNNKSRAALIRRWVAVGRDEFAEDELIESETRRVKLLMDRSLGSNLAIKYPFFLLVILQQIDAGQEAKTVVRNGTQGHIFEAMISSAIDSKVKSHDVGVVHDFLANLAFNLRAGELQVVSEDGFKILVAEFRRDKLVQLTHPNLLNELIESGILQRTPLAISFRYSHFYFYYIARWISFNKERSAADELLQEFIDKIHSESAANVVTFVAHFGHEKWVLTKLMPAAKDLFSGSSECRLSEHGALAEKYRALSKDVVLLAGSPIDVTDQFSDVEDQFEPDSGSAELEDAFKYMTAARIIQVLGQIMRSRAGGVGASDKREIAKSAISLSRRLMTVLYSAAELSAEVIIEHASELFDTDVKSDTKAARHQATLLVASVVGGIAKGLVSRAADVAATRDLLPLIESIEDDAKKDGDVDVELIMLCARISAEQDYPSSQVNALMKKLPPSDVLSHAALAHSVARMFYLTPPNRAVRDSACERLGIKLKNIPASFNSRRR